MHILLLHEYFLRPGQGGGERFNVMAREWVEAGARVTVIAGQTDYVTGMRPAGVGLLEDETVGEVRVIRPWTPGHGKASTPARMLGMAAFGVSATAALSRVSGWDVCVATSPSLGAFAAGLAASRKGPVVAEVRDLWPESAVTVGVVPAGHPAVAAAYSVEETMYESAAHVVALTPGIAANIRDRGLVRSGAISVLPNGWFPSAPTSEFLRRSIRRQRGWDDRFVVIYTGAHGRANDLGQLVTAAAQCPDDVLFVLVGDGPTKRELRRRAGTNVEFVDSVDHDELRGLLGAADAGAVCLQRNPTFRTVYPNKLFDYMGAGLPVLCGVEGDAAELVERAECGLLVRPGDVQHWVAQLRELRRSDTASMGLRGRAFVSERFDRRAIAAEYLKLLRGLI